MIRNHFKISENSCQFEENSKLHYTFKEKKNPHCFLETFEGATK